MSVTVQEISAAARAGIAAVTAETAGYFVLAVVDQLGNSSGKLGSVHLAEDGTVIVGKLGDGSETGLEAEVRALLGSLLGPNSSRAPALARAALASSSRGMSRLASELEAALIPVNRAAARRALSRLHRDTVRAKTTGKLASPPVEAPKPPLVVLSAIPASDPPPILEKATHPVSDVPAPTSVATRTPLVPEVSWPTRGPDATPFLGTWTAVAPVAGFLPPEPGDHDTERVPPVSFETSPPPFAEVAVIAEPSMAGVESGHVTASVLGPEPIADVASVSVAELGLVSDPQEATCVEVIHASQDAPRVSTDAQPVLAAPVDAEEPSGGGPPELVLGEGPAPEVVAVGLPAFEAPVTGAALRAESESESALATALCREEPIPEVAHPIEPVDELAPALAEVRYAAYQPRKSDVADLVAGFGVEESRSLTELSRELTRMAGVGTPCPPPAVPASVSRKRSLAR